MVLLTDIDLVATKPTPTYFNRRGIWNCATLVPFPAASNSSVIRKHVKSSSSRPTNWSATGRPPSVSPWTGKAVAGSRVRFATAGQKQPR
mmetsp:Transcript_36871/g.42894  ORF Transcript_36871/g.42894 Transcript_36871/m.42894 type:complete len:90 (+) Transcript_36871:516-785(+)